MDTDLAVGFMGSTHPCVCLATGAECRGLKAGVQFVFLTCVANGSSELSDRSRLSQALHFQARIYFSGPIPQVSHPSTAAVVSPELAEATGVFMGGLGFFILFYSCLSKVPVGSKYGLGALSRDGRTTHHLSSDPPGLAQKTEPMPGFIPMQEIPVVLLQLLGD